MGSTQVSEDREAEEAWDASSNEVARYMPRLIPNWLGCASQRSAYNLNNPGAKLATGL